MEDHSAAPGPGRPFARHPRAALRGRPHHAVLCGYRGLHHRGGHCDRPDPLWTSHVDPDDAARLDDGLRFPHSAARRRRRRDDLHPPRAPPADPGRAGSPVPGAHARLAAFRDRHVLRSLLAQEPDAPHAPSFQPQAAEDDHDDRARRRARAERRRTPGRGAAAVAHRIRPPLRADREGRRRLMSIGAWFLGPDAHQGGTRDPDLGRAAAGGRARLLQDVPAPQIPRSPAAPGSCPTASSASIGSRALHACGIPCTEPISWTHGSDRRHGRHEILVTREIPSAVPLKYLHERSRSPCPISAAICARAPHARVRRRARRLLPGEHPGLGAGGDPPDST